MPPFKEVLGRPVLQIFITYIGVSWGLVQCVDWLTDRYLWSPNLTDLVILLVILMTPSILILAYFRGEPGATPWTWSERIGIPLNVGVALIVLFVNFQNKELGPLKDTITMADSNGRMIAREVPKSAYRKKIGLFYFKNNSGDATLDWLRQGIPNALDTDLSQDLFLDIREGVDFAEQLQKKGFSYRDNIALGLAQDLALNARLPYLVMGSFTREDRIFKIRLDLYETTRIKRLARHEYQGADLFGLIDQMTEQLKKDLGIPTSYLERVIDIPVNEVLTDSLASYSHFIVAQNKLTFDKDYTTASTEFDQAIKVDPSFANAYYYQFITLFNGGQIDRSNTYLAKAKKYLFKLTEQRQFIVRLNDAFVQGKAKNQLPILENWITLYPDDLTAHSRLARYYEHNDQSEKAITTYQKMQKLDPDEYSYTELIAGLHVALAQYPEALKNYEIYAERVPDQAAPWIQQGNMYIMLGDFPQAQVLFEKALRLDPDNSDALLMQGALLERQGQWDQARTKYQQVLAQKQTAPDRVNALNFLIGNYVARKQWKSVVANLPAQLALKSQTSNPISGMIATAQTIDIYIKAGLADQSLEQLKKLEVQAQKNRLLGSSVKLGYLQYYLASDQPEQAALLIPQIEEVYSDYGLIRLARELRLGWAKGKIAELQNNYSLALDRYQAYLRSTPNDEFGYIDLARVQRSLKDYSGAKSSLEKLLRSFPSYPEAHYELAQIYQAQGDQTKARQALDQALAGWAGADPQDPLVQKARALATDLDRV